MAGEHEAHPPRALGVALDAAWVRHPPGEVVEGLELIAGTGERLSLRRGDDLRTHPSAIVRGLHRLTMAKRVWARMKAADSQECRNCHKFETMDQAKQKDRSVVKHEGAIEDGKTCIECHQGIAHKSVHQLLAQEEAAKKP